MRGSGRASLLPLWWCLLLGPFGGGSSSFFVSSFQHSSSISFRASPHRRHGISPRLLDPQAGYGNPLVVTQQQQQQQPRSIAPPQSSTTRLMAVSSLLASLPSSLTFKNLVSGSLVAAAVLFLAQKLLFKNKQRQSPPTERRFRFHPLFRPDPAYQEPLPPGDLGCPFFGNTWAALGLTKEAPQFGAGYFYLRQSRKLAAAAKRLWLYSFVGRPVVVLAGLKNLQTMLQSEFEPTGVSALGVSTQDKKARQSKARIMGSYSMISEGNKQRHQQLRRLVGQALTPAAVANSIPQLQAAAMEQAHKLQTCSGTTSIEDYCTEFTLDVAWRQILGLELKPEEIPAFRTAVYDWVTGQTTIQASTGRGVQYTAGYKARLLLESKIRERIRSLREEEQGADSTADSSTLRAMVFAVDDDEDDTDAGENGDTTNTKKTTKTKLTQDEVVDNAMLLILAGTETAASTMTNALLFMGLSPHVWQQVKNEQQELAATHGPVLTKQVLDESPYLEAVIKETMRLRPVPTGLPRMNLATTIIDGQQIPKGWIFDWSILLTHQLDPTTWQEDGSHMDIQKGFQPERWLSEETMPVEYMPMGGGPRYCLGATLAVTEMKVFLATLVLSMDYQLTGATAKGVNQLKWRRMSFVPKERNGVLVNIVPSSSFSSVKEHPTTNSTESTLAAHTSS